jgi:hypothetical protein
MLYYYICNKEHINIRNEVTISYRCARYLFVSNGLESREYGRRDSSRWPRGTLYPQKKLALTSLTSGGRSVGIVRLRTEGTDFFYVFGRIYFSGLK